MTLASVTLFLAAILPCSVVARAQDPAGLPETQPSPAQAPEDSGSAGYTPAPHTFSSDALHLRFRYPDLLQEAPPESAVTHGRINLLGLNADRVTAGDKADLTACLRPVFFARTPAPAEPATTAEHTAPNRDTTVRLTPAPVASLLLADLDTACLSGKDQVSRTDLLATLAQQFLVTPGMSRSAGPATYTIGYQRVTMAAAQGRPQTPPPSGSDASVPPTASSLPAFTMAVATNWSNHLLVWLLSSDQIGLLDQLSKSTVRFGRAQPEPLYPQPLGNSTPAETP